MPGILVNYKPNKKNVYVEIKDYGYILADKPIAIAELDQEYEKAIAVDIGKVFPVIMEERDFIAWQTEDNKKNKTYRLKFKEDGIHFEEANETDDASLCQEWRGPIGFDISKLVFFNGEILWEEILPDDIEIEKGDE
jgi:desulfoferrodoxin (superoxide reductase-like protein)